ncbi:MAG: hypothetical protein IT338_04755, partial [Thermomicrobiales bacterium]|nr:hypothetical protein [Thermomicrobiales bacterium]
QLCCNGNCLTGDCCADGERDACAAGQVCCDHACVSGDCCADANCATETCQRASCQDHHCAYSPVTGGDGPGCATICCQDATGSPTCCADGTTTCDSNGHCCQPESKETTCATGSANPKCGQVPNNCGQQVDCGPCADRTCQSGTCSDADHTCHYTSVFGTSGPNCTTVCCEDINEESVCCPSGATVCRAVDGLCGCAGDAACGTGKHCCGNGECQQCCSVDDCPPNATCQAGTCVGGCDVCPSGCAYTSLQAAIAGTPTGGTIRLCPGTYATSVVVPKNLTIIGAGDGDGGTILDGGTTSRVFDIASGVTVTITDLTITRGNGDVGGGILVRPDGASLTMERVQVTNCQSTGLAPSGAGVSVSGGSSALLMSCGIAYNVSQGAGGRGGGFLNNSTLTLDATRVEANQAASGGGGINFGTLVLKNGSVVTNNTATAGPGNGGGILNWAGTVSVSADSSVTGNHPDDCVNAFGGTGCPA